MMVILRCAQNDRFFSKLIHHQIDRLAASPDMKTGELVLIRAWCVEKRGRDGLAL